MRPALWRLPPAGERLAPGGWYAALATTDPAATLRAALAPVLDGRRLGLYASGREALRVLFAAFAGAAGRREIVLPGYTCYSVAAAAVAAGCRVRLVDVDACGRIDVDDLRRLPLERAAAVVVCNLYGVPEPVAPVAALAVAAGAAVVDDAAQSLGARAGDGWVGARGDAGVLSFGRGKALGGLGGGALVGGEAAELPPPPSDPGPRPLAALLAASAHGLALSPWAFPWIARLPGLHVGETPFEPGFERGPMDGAALSLAAATAPHARASAAARARRAEALGRALQGGGFAPLLASADQSGVYPRLGVVAPDAEERDRALSALARIGAGASPSYPASLDCVAPLAPHRADDRPLPGARAFAARILTLPTHAGLRGRVRAATLDRLRSAHAVAERSESASEGAAPP